MGSTFENPMTYWFGMDFASEDPAALEEFNDFYNTIHVGEVVANNPGFVLGHRYEQIPTGSVGRGPQFVAMYEIGDDESGEAFIERSRGPRRPRTGFTPEPAVWMDNMVMQWSLVWRKLVDTGATSEPEEILMIGLAPARNGDAATHAFGAQAMIVAGESGYDRGALYSMALAQRYPDDTPPGFCLIYESKGELGDDIAQIDTDELVAGIVGPSGRSSWTSDDVEWSLRYRRVGP